MTAAEIGDAACKILITGGGFLLVVIPAAWLVRWLRGSTHKKTEIIIEED